jgi:hypothetical protein
MTISELVSMADAYRVIDGDLPVMVATATGLLTRSDPQEALELRIATIQGKNCLVIVAASGK